MVSANHYRAAWSTKVVSREMPVDDGAVVSIIHDARPPISIADVWVEHSRCQLRAEGAAVQARPPGRRGRRPPVNPGQVERIIRTAAFVINDREMARLFRRLVRDTAGRDHSFKTERRVAIISAYVTCVPSICFWFGSRAPAVDSFVHTPSFGRRELA